MDRTSKCSWNGTSEKAASEDGFRTKPITKGPRDQANKECGSKGNDITIGDFILAQMEILLDRFGEKRWERILFKEVRNAQNNIYVGLTQDMKAIMKPHQEKKKTRPNLLIGLKIGMDLAFPLIGFTSGAVQRAAKLTILTNLLKTKKFVVLNE